MISKGVPQPLVVAIPASATNIEGANPTGIVCQFRLRLRRFRAAGVSGPSVFIFVERRREHFGLESHRRPRTNAIIAVDDGEEGSVYKGAALGESSSGLRLFVTNFRGGRGRASTTTPLPRSRTTTPSSIPDVPARFSPFGIENINGLIYVTYAKRDLGR